MRLMAGRLARSGWPYVLPVAVIALSWPWLSPSPALGDHFQFWAAGHLVATGRSMYDRSAWETMAALGTVPGGVAVNTVTYNLTQDVWAYPPMIALLLAPFGALPLGAGVAGLRGAWLGAGVAIVTIKPNLAIACAVASVLVLLWIPIRSAASAAS